MDDLYQVLNLHNIFFKLGQTISKQNDKNSSSLEQYYCFEKIYRLQNQSQ